MNTKTFVTPDDFKNNCYGGFDLREAIRNDYYNSPSNQAEMFLELVTKHLLTWVDVNSFRNFHWDVLTPFQTESLRDAIIAQAHYTYREGPKAFGMFAGSDDEHGKIFDPDYIRRVKICDACLDILTRAGLFNLNIKNRRKTWPAGGNYGFF